MNELESLLIAFEKSCDESMSKTQIQNLDTVIGVLAPVIVEMTGYSFEFTEAVKNKMRQGTMQREDCESILALLNEAIRRYPDYYKRNLQ